MPRKSERIVIRQSSMHEGDTVTEKRDDLLQVFGTGCPDVVAFTEVSGSMRIVLRQIAGAHGYHSFSSPSDISFAVSDRHRIRSSGYVKTLNPHVGMSKGNFGERGVGHVTFVTPAGNVITEHATHWLTQYHLDREAGDEGRREHFFSDQTRDMIKQTLLHNHGRLISFWSGDTNLDEPRDTGFDHDAVHAKFKAAGLVSIYDDLGEFPATLGSRTIDIIGRVLADGRVKPVDVNVHRRNGRHADHLMVDATYEIRP